MNREVVLLVLVSVLLFSAVPVIGLVERGVDVAGPGESGQRVLSGTGQSGGVDWWPMFRHDLRHTGYSTSKAPKTNNTLWNYTTGDGVFSSPAVADGKVYVGSWDNKVYCLDASTGVHIWNYTTGWDVWSSPAVADGKVYVGSDDDKVYCLSASTGALVWNYTTGGDVDSSPAVADGKVYVGSWDNKVYCLDASTGGHIWNYTTGGYVFLSSPAVVDGRVYVGSGDNKTYCLNASTGGHIWNYTTGDRIRSSPAVADGRVFVGSSDDRVYALNASTGGHIWNYTTGWDVWLSSPAVADGKVYVGSDDDKVYCLDASTGVHIWNYTTGGDVDSSPAVADGMVFIGSPDFKVYCFGSHDVAVIREPATQWSKTYGGTEREYARSVIQTGDGGYAIVGRTNSSGAGGVDCWLIKTDSTGNTQWNKTYGGANNDAALSLVQTGDGGYALAGVTYSYGAGGGDSWLVKTDSAGNALWNKTYGGANYDVTLSLVQTSDGGYAIAGHTKSFGAGRFDSWLVKTDLTGNMLWNKTYGGVNDDVAISLVQIGDGGYALAGITKSYGAGGFDSWLVKTDSAGNALWNKTYGGVGDDVAWSVLQTADGGYALAGSTYSYGAGDEDSWLIKVGPSPGADRQTVYKGQDVNIIIVVKNEGTVPETFNVTAYYNTMAIETKTVTNLAPNAETTLTFIWNTAGVAKGNYTISAVADTVPGETDTADNTFIDGTVTILVEAWPMFHHDLRHTGYSTSKAPKTNNTLWNYTTGDLVFSSPAVVDGMVFVGSYDYQVYALNASSGAFIWNYTTGHRVFSSPAVVDGRVYVGSRDNKTYCLDASTGTHIWNYTTGGYVFSSPAVADGMVFVGSCDYQIYALNATTGAFIWNYTTGHRVFSSPAVVDGMVFVGSLDKKVYALNASTGNFIWNYTTGGGVFSSPAVVDGKVYAGSMDNKTYCLDASTGTHIWNYTTGDMVWSSPAVADGKVYVGSDDDKVYCLSASTGALVWSYTTGLDVDSSPAVADGKVYVGSWDGKVYCLDAATGVHIWNYTTGGGVFSSPAIVDGKVYVGSMDNKTYAFGWVPPWTIWTRYHNYAEIVETLLYLNSTYPNIVDVFSIGKSWENQDIYCIRLTNENITHPKPKVFFVGYHHARELISAELPLYFAVEAATNYNTNETITHMINYSEIYIVPALNPDGFAAVEANEWHRKNVHPYDEDGDTLLDEDPPDDEDGDGYIEDLFFWNGTHYEFIRWEGIDDDGDGSSNEDWVGGVDPNRNYGYQWNATCDSGSPNPSAEDYRGPAPFSEPETQAMRDLALQHDFKYAISFHSGAEVILYPWGYTNTPTPHDSLFREIAGNLSSLVGAPYAQSGAGLYTASGLWDDWMYGNRSVFALTCEIYINHSAWQYEPGPDPDTWWEKGVFQFFNPDPSQIETVIQRWLPIFTYITNRAITEAYDIATTNLTTVKTIVGQGFSVHINVTVVNEGDFTETFNVTAYANTTIINTLMNIALTGGSSTTLTVPWNTTGIPKGNYTIKAHATPVPGETDTADNNHTDGWILVTVPGDVNGDCTCDMLDVSILIDKFLSEPSDPQWDPNCDVDCDDSIDMLDISIAIEHFLEDT